MSAVRRQIELLKAAKARRDNIAIRLIATLAIALILHVYVQMTWVWLWAVIYLSALGLERRLLGDVVRNPDTPPAAWRRWIILVMPAVTSATFGFLALPLFASSARFAPTLGAMLLAGSLLNVIVVNSGLRSATITAAAPHVLYLLIVPLVARAANPDAPLANALWFGALLMIVSVVVAARTLCRALEAEAAAKAEVELRRYEAEEAVAAKSAFVAMVSHELRTPISAILAGAARLASDAPDATARNHAHLISTAGEMMRALLNDLLDLSRLEAGRMAIDKAPFDLRQAIADSVRLWRDEIQKKGLRLRIEGASGLPRWVLGDPLRLRQVLNNLMSNAVKFTAQGSITVRVASRDEDGRHRIEIVVIDTGPGVAPQDLDRVFMPFDQLNARVAREHGGSGLGLVISRELSRLMGGDLTLESRPGEGAQFRFTLEVEPTSEPAADGEGGSISGARVLVVDDHVVNRRAVELILEPFGVHATLAESGERGLELLGSEVFDVVLMDVYMPGMDGRETTRQLRASSGPNRDIPVVAVTASATVKDWEACRAAGMNAHVAKPIDPGELYAALIAVLPRSAADPAQGAVAG